MDTANWPITVRKGRTQDVVWTFTIDATPVDLTGYSALMEVRAARDETSDLVAVFASDPGDVDVTFTGPVGTLTLGGAAGTIRREMDATTAEDLPVGSWRYELKLVPTAGEAVSPFAGPFNVEKRVTI